MRELARKMAPPLAIALHAGGNLLLRTLVNLPLALSLAYGVRFLQPELNLWRTALMIAVIFSIQPVFLSSWGFVQGVQGHWRDRVHE